MSPERRIILGLDPGLALLGYGVVATEGHSVTHVEHGCLTTPAGSAVPERLQVLYEGLSAIRRRLAITDVAMESLFYSRNVSTAISVGQARGVAMVATVDGSTRFGEYTPNEVKHVVSGFGGARKRQVQEMVALILGLATLPTPDDAADALAIAICHAQRAELSAVLAQARGA